MSKSKTNFSEIEHSCERVGGLGTDYTIYYHNDKWCLHIFDDKDNDHFMEDIKSCPFCSKKLNITMVSCDICGTGIKNVKQGKAKVSNNRPYYLCNPCYEQEERDM